MEYAVRFRDAVSLAGRFPLLAGLSLEIDEGEVADLRGANGAGKTSLLRACAGLIPIASGEGVVLGHDLCQDRISLRREVGLLGHATFLYDELSATDNVRFAVRASRGDLGRVGPALERLGLAGRLVTTPVARLSAGQRRRCALAVLVARAPRLWLLDEPHAGLDHDSRGVLDAVIGEARAAGATVLLASHELERAAVLADRVIEMSGGQVVTGLEPVTPPAPSGEASRVVA